MLHHNGRDQIAGAHLATGWGSYEAPLPTVFAACVSRARGVVVDVGANTGFYTLLALTANPHVVVQAFEPLDAIADALEANLVLNEFRDRVKLNRVAVSDGSGTAVLYVPTDEHGLLETSASLNPDFKARHLGATQIPTVALDDVSLAEENRVAILKVDVESLEYKVLKGARLLLERDRPLVYLEVLPGADIPALEAMRTELRYTDVRVGPGWIAHGEPIKFDPDAWNHVLVPDETSAEWIELIDQVVASPAAAGATMVGLPSA